MKEPFEECIFGAVLWYLWYKMIFFSVQMASRYDLFSACQGAAVENLKKNLEFSTFVSCLPTAVQKDEAFCKAIYQVWSEITNKIECFSTNKLRGRRQKLS